MRDKKAQVEIPRPGVEPGKPSGESGGITPPLLSPEVFQKQALR